MEKYTMFIDQKNQYSGNEYTIQSNLQIQCNPYQIINGIFHRLRPQNFSLYGNTKTPEQPKQSSERKMELEETGSLNSYYTIKLQ